MKKHHKIRLTADLKTDTKNAVDFIKYNRSGEYKRFVDCFLPDDLKYILGKKYSKKQRDEIIRAYTNKAYKEKRQEIAHGVKKAIKNWRKIENRYFQLVDKVFKNHPWPKGDYRGFASIFRMYPRYIKQKVFFFPYAHKIPQYANKVIAHEMLHFIFFDYIEKKYGLKEGDKISGKATIWQISEVFNNAMESWAPYNKIFKEKPRPYRGTEKMFTKMKKQWAKKQDIDWLLDKWFI